MSDGESDLERTNDARIELFTKELLHEHIKEPLESFQGNKTLSLSGLGIKKMEDLTEFPQLTRLDVSTNYLESLRCISACINLTTLNVSHNNLSGKGLRGIVTLGRLTALNASFNRIKKIPPFVFEALQHLKALILNNNQVCDLSFMENTHNLNTLILSHNEITDDCLKAQYFEEMKELRKLSLAYNSITTINLPLMPSLHELNLSHNGLTTIPDSILQLPKLFLLDISNNNISDLKELEKLKAIPTLHQLICDNNPLMNDSVTIQTLHELIPQLTHINRVVTEEYSQRKIQRKRTMEERKEKLEAEREAKRLKRMERIAEKKAKKESLQGQKLEKGQKNKFVKKGKLPQKPAQEKTPKKGQATKPLPKKKQPEKTVPKKQTKPVEKKEPAPQVQKTVEVPPKIEKPELTPAATGVISIETEKKHSTSGPATDVFAELSNNPAPLDGWD